MRSLDHLQFSRVIKDRALPVWLQKRNKQLCSVTQVKKLILLLDIHAYHIVPGKCLYPGQRPPPNFDSFVVFRGTLCKRPPC